MSVSCAAAGGRSPFHGWIDLPAAYPTMAWIGLTGLVILILPSVVRATSEPSA